MTADDTLARSLSRWIARCARAAGESSRTQTVGICGSQGSGKSTLAQLCERLLSDLGIRCVTLSLDDLYLSHIARIALSRDVHPLLATRGVPGTHDVPLGLETLAALKRRGTCRVPRFDKSRDNPCPPAAWPQFSGPAEVILFEGWCVGARPQYPSMLQEPVNALERDEDADGRWRGFVNDALAGTYQTLFSTLDTLIFLKAPSFDVVHRWRGEQEVALRESLRVPPQKSLRDDSSGNAPRDTARTMSEAELSRFISHYERLTRWMIDEMPARADITVELNADRTTRAIHERSGAEWLTRPESQLPHA